MIFARSLAKLLTIALVVVIGVAQFGCKRQKPPVDSIQGFASFKVGATRESLEGRLVPLTRYPVSDVNNCERSVADNVGDESQWAGVPVEWVSLEFDRGLVRRVEVNFTDANFRVLRDAFKMRFGAEKYNGWEGEDTRISYQEADSSFSITSKTIDQMCDQARSEESKREQAVSDEQARKVAERL